MRRILIDYAVARRRQKRGGGQVLVSLDDEDVLAIAHERGDELLALDEALDAPAGDERASGAHRRMPLLRRDERRGDRRGAERVAGDGQA